MIWLIIAGLVGVGAFAFLACEAAEAAERRLHHLDDPTDPNEGHGAERWIG